METYDLRDSGFDWLGNIPIHWGIDRLKDVAHLRDEKTTAKSSDEDYLELEDLSQWTGKILNRRNTLEVASQVNVFYEGDVLFGKLRPYLAKYAYVDFNGKCTGEILAIEPIRIYGGFLAYYVGSKHFINHCDNFAYGAKMPRINWTTQMGIFPIPIPPLFEEQKAIADYLDKACQNIDKTITLKQQQLEKLEAYRKSVIHKAVTKGLDKTVPMKDSGVEWLGKIPNHWKVDRLRDVAIINEQALGANTDPNYEIRYIDISNVNINGIVNLDDIKNLTFEEAPSRARRIVKQGDTIISSVRTNLQAVAYINFNSQNLIASTGFFVCHAKFSEKVIPKFLYLFLLTNYSKDYFFSRSVGVSYPAIDDYKFGSIPMPLPTTKEQNAITDFLDKACTNIDKTKETITNQINTLTQYRQSLIHECVTGKKRIYQGETQ